MFLLSPSFRLLVSRTLSWPSCPSSVHVKPAPASSWQGAGIFFLSFEFVHQERCLPTASRHDAWRPSCIRHPCMWSLPLPTSCRGKLKSQACPPPFRHPCRLVAGISFCLSAMASHVAEPFESIFLELNPQKFVSGDVDGAGFLALGLFDEFP